LVTEQLLKQREESRESHFWDVFSDTSPVTPVRAGELDVYSEARIGLLGPVDGRHVLDLGCGVGYSASALALRGARVEAVDISPGCVRVTARRAQASGVGASVGTHVMSAYSLAFPDAAFDAIHGQDILHHLDIEQAGREIKRVLRTNGVAVFQENNANNPVLMFARRFCGHFGIPKWSTDDEYPLTRAEVRQLGQVFDGQVDVHYPMMEFFALLDMKIFRCRSRAITQVCLWLDRAIYRWLPPLRPYGWKQIVVLRKVQ
jgi:ubiquinone/menaquinone biosynthesis C-methylase UbiE